MRIIAIAVSTKRDEVARCLQAGIIISSSIREIMAKHLLWQAEISAGVTRCKYRRSEMVSKCHQRNVVS